MRLSPANLPLLESERKPRTPRRIPRYTSPRAPRLGNLSFSPSYTLRGLGEGTGSVLWGSIVPSQLWCEPGWSSEQLLMAAVLIDARDCVEQGRKYPYGRHQRLAQEARAWFREEDTWWPFSFVNICAALGLDAEMVRDAVLGRRGAA
jgi:hypothetical protein